VIQLAQLQQRMLSALWQQLKPGGRLLYVTCSLLPEENDAAIAALLSQHKDVSVLTIALPGAMATRYGQQLVPSVAAVSSDGFYYALLRRAVA
jgi:16S rRNA (cytosine967-C5)-methyltransferase